MTMTALRPGPAETLGYANGFDVTYTPGPLAGAAVTTLIAKARPDVVALHAPGLAAAAALAAEYFAANAQAVYSAAGFGDGSGTPQGTPLLHVDSDEISFNVLAVDAEAVGAKLLALLADDANAHKAGQP